MLGRTYPRITGHDEPGSMPIEGTHYPTKL